MDMIRKPVNSPVRLSVRSSFLIILCVFLALNAIGIAQEPVGQVAAQKPVAIEVFEIGKVSTRAFTKRWTRASWAFNDWINPLYIINYGTNKEIARREKVITDSISYRNFDRNRITLARGGLGIGSRTVVWKIPPGADNPSP